MDDLWGVCAAVAADPNAHLVELKKASDAKIIGCFPMHAPEEMIHAAGLHPAIVFGSHDPIGEADAHIQPYVCSVVRSTFDLALQGKLQAFDGLIFPDICDAVQCLSDIWRRTLNPKFAFNYVLPAKTSGTAAERYSVWELGRMRSALEEFAGRRIADDDLRQSFALFNRHRALLRELCAIRRSKPGALGAARLANAVVSGMVMRKEDHCKLLEGLIEQSSAAQPAREGVRVVLTGNLCDDPEGPVLNMIEELGGIVVDDDLYTGSKYLLRDIPADLDPLVALSRRDTLSAPCPTRHDTSGEKNAPDHILRLVQGSGAQAVIILQVKFCEPHSFEYPYTQERLDAASVPHFVIETEHEMSNLGQVRTRLQAFFEMVAGE